MVTYAARDQPLKIFLILCEIKPLIKLCTILQLFSLNLTHWMITCFGLKTSNVLNNPIDIYNVCYLVLVIIRQFASAWFVQSLSVVFLQFAYRLYLDICSALSMIVDRRMINSLSWVPIRHRPPGFWLRYDPQAFKHSSFEKNPLCPGMHV